MVRVYRFAARRTDRIQAKPDPVGCQLDGAFGLGDKNGVRLYSAGQPGGARADCLLYQAKLARAFQGHALEPRDETISGQKPQAENRLV